jgi:branched-chain amino acid transport system ATP-binding protein
LSDQHRLQVEGITVGYGRAAPIIRGVSLELDDGCVTTLIGPNGAGKSTLLKSIAGLVELRSGEIYLSGQPVGHIPAHLRARLGIGTCAQGRVNFSHMTVEENLRLAGFALGRQELKARLAELREGDPFLRDRWHTRVGDLSGGQQQFVEVAMALVHVPSVLLLDEPSLGLSPAARRSVLDRARAIAEGGTCVLIVEQNVRAATAVSDRVVVLDQGRIALDGRPGDILGDSALRDIYVGAVGDRKRQRPSEDATMAAPSEREHGAA